MTRVYKDTLNLQQMRHLIKEAMAATYQPESYSYLLESPKLLDEASIHKNKYPFKALYMFGPAGAGKSYLIKNQLKIPLAPSPDLKGKPTDKLGFWTSNPDIYIEEVFPTFGISMKFANSEEGDDAELEKLQQISRKVLQNAVRTMTANKLAIANPIIFDTTGEEVPKQVKKMKALAALGYDIAVMMINVPEEASVERDTKRDRTVGADRTAGISQEYQKSVVEQGQYFKKLSGIPNVTLLTDRVFNNIFDLESGDLLKKPTEITPAMLPDELNPQKNPDAAKLEKATLDGAIAKLGTFLKTPVQNPGGQKLLKAMRALVKHPGPPEGHPDKRSRELDPDTGKETEAGAKGYHPGSLGQNMNDLVIAMSKGYFQEPEIVAGAEHLSKLGGGATVVKKAKGGGVKQAAGASEDSPALQGAIRGKKDVGGATIRGKEREFSYPGLTGAKDAMGSITKEPPRQRTYKEAIDYDDLVEMIREVIAKKP